MWWIVTFLLCLPCVKSSFALGAFCISSPNNWNYTSAHLTVLSLFNPALNLTFSLLPITSSHPHASASDSTFDFWRCINIWVTLTLMSFESLTEGELSHSVEVTSCGRSFPVCRPTTSTCYRPDVINNLTCLYHSKKGNTADWHELMIP